MVKFKSVIPNKPVEEAGEGIKSTGEDPVALPVGSTKRNIGVL